MINIHPENAGNKNTILFKGIPVHVCEKVPLYPELTYISNDIKNCPYCFEPLQFPEREMGMLPEAFVQLANSLIQLVLKIQEGQPPEVRKQLWDWYVQDIKWWRKFLKIDI